MRNRLSIAPRPPTETGVRHGRPYWLWLPDDAPPWPGMLILHGAGSRKENHGDFGRACAAAGWAAIAYDQPGHGSSKDELTPAALDDVERMAGVLAEVGGVDAARICARGSSMGGCIAIHAGATVDAIRGVIAICPAGEEHLLRGLRRGELECRAGPAARRALEAWLGGNDVRVAAANMGTKPLILIHAEGDDRIAHEFSSELYARSAEPCKLIVVPGGHHRSAQHDPELHGVALRWLRRALR